jgi:hypothetical protein
MFVQLHDDQGLRVAQVGHPEQADQTIWQMFAAECCNLVPYAGPFDGFHSVPASVSKT